MEGCHNGGVIPDLNLTRGDYTFNPARVVETYIGMRDPTGLARLMMQARQSVSYSVYGCRPAGGKRFNLHDPGEKTCFKPKNVMGVHKIEQLVPTFSTILNLPHATNRQVRATAIQALRMASYTTEEVAKVSRHRRPSTIDKHYDPGLRTSTRADMAVAVAQAASMKRGHGFFSVSEHLPRKMSRATVQFKLPGDMAPALTSTPLSIEEPYETVSFTSGSVGSEEFVSAAWEREMSGDLEVSQTSAVFSQQVLVTEPQAKTFATNFGDLLPEPQTESSCAPIFGQMLTETSSTPIYGQLLTEPQTKTFATNFGDLITEPRAETSCTPIFDQPLKELQTKTSPAVELKSNTVPTSGLSVSSPTCVQQLKPQTVPTSGLFVSSLTCGQQLKPLTDTTSGLLERKLAR